jgi:curved DNA-binding protein CbpA
LAGSATSDEIKHAFRREISKYHPDKVQHLGREFQDMAADLAASLTEAYRVLMDTELRAQYDEELLGDQGSTTSHAATATREAPGEPARPEPAAVPASPAGARVSPNAGIDLVRRATLARLKDAAASVLAADVGRAAGFDIAFTAHGRKGLFRKAEPGIRLLVKFVPHVDADAIARVWPDAMATAPADTIFAVLLLGFGMASPKELSRAITEQRQLRGAPGPILIPVDMRDWEALFPADTPAPLRLLIERLRSNQG